MEVAPGIIQLKIPIPNNPLGNLNSYLIEGTEGWLMVDTGWFTPETLDSLKKGLQTWEIELADIATLVITHIHPDHFGLAGRIKQISPKIELLMHRFEADLIESRYIKLRDLRQKIGAMLSRHGVPQYKISELESSSLPAMEYVRITGPDGTLYGGETVSTGTYGLEVIWTPGHSIGHICLYEPNNQLLFAGDHILPQITPSVGYHTQSGDNPLGDYLNALRKIKNLPVKKVLPAHEEIFSDLRGRISEIIEHHKERSEEIVQTITKGPKSAYKISSQITWNVKDSDWENLPPLSKRLAVMETLAHLEQMRWEGKVQKYFQGDFVSFGLQ